jgi:hypothetical protein
MNLMDLFFFPVTAPIKGTLWVMEQIRDKAMKELYDPDTLRAQLLQLRISYERGTIEEVEYRERSEQIWEQLTESTTEDTDGDEDGYTTDEEQ